MDDVEVRTNGQSLLTQLKHSISTAPNPVTIKSKALWKTLKVWIDVLPRLVITETKFQLVSVAPLGKDSLLSALIDENLDRTSLHDALVNEANRVITDRKNAESSGKKGPLPHADRFQECQTFLNLPENQRKLILKRTSIRAGTQKISEIENQISALLINFPPEMREQIARKLLEWWDLQMIFSLCGKREKFINKIEVQTKIAEIAGEIERDELLPDFETAIPPNEYQSDSMLAKQVELVNGKKSDLQYAIREEWRARSQRHKWLNERLDMGMRIQKYDQILEETWSDKHIRMIEDCENSDENEKRRLGLELLRWVHEHANKEVQPFANNWNSPYYIRGSYQVLAINLKVGWHPNFKNLLGKNS
ncbi:ABC-three component system protein [Undibacterium pigrum]|uniref:ABC-three component system protein n=1 Tax=Undibacterium pigrum TaxID=401470 RepID=UPI000D7536AC|nr:ABC-three component system protein [Undibacterium pigrum]